MKGTLLLENLLEKISLLNSAISTRPPLPVLSGILITAEKGKIKLSATDLELGIETSVPANIEEDGSGVIPARPFFETLTNLSEERITIEKKEEGIIVSGKNTRVAFVDMDTADFPKIIGEKGENTITLKREILEKEFPRVVFATSVDSGKPAFSGILLKPEKDNFVIVATDSHRLSLSKTQGARLKVGASKKQLLVSAKTIRAILSQKNNEEVSIYVLEKNNQVVFSFGETTIVGRLIDAEFPDFEKIIPETSSSKTEFDRQELLRALKVVSVFARDNANIIKMSIKKDFIQVFAKSQSLGENSVTVTAKTTGEENEIAFNSRYLIELLQNVSDEQMVFEMQGPLNPGVFKIAKDPNFVHLIMPIRVKEEDLN